MKFLKKLRLLLSHLTVDEDKIGIDCDIDMNYRRIANVCNPFLPGDAASKFYVEGSWKNALFVAMYGVSTFEEVDEQVWGNGVVHVKKDEEYYHLWKIEYDPIDELPCKYLFFSKNNVICVDKNDTWSTLTN